MSTLAGGRMRGRARMTAVLAAALVVVGLRGAVGCGSSGVPEIGANGANGNDGGSSGLFGSGDGGGSGGIGPVGANNGDVIVQPPDATLAVTGPGTTLAYQAFLKGSATPSAANWFLDDPAFGTIDASGLFTASALTGGVVHVTAQVGQEVGTTSLTIQLSIRENPGGVDPGTQGGLEHGGAADTAFRWLYPYDHTVFPRGLTGPTMQFDGVAPDAILVRVKSKLFDYEGFYKPSAPSQLAISDMLWTALTNAAQAGEQVSVQVTKSSAGAVTGPISESWAIAQGSLKGTVYYNTYTSPAANGAGAVMRIKPGADATVFLGGAAGCTVCHTVSANGSVLTASHGTSEVLGDYNSGTSYDLANGGAPIHQQADSAFSFGALTPDGALLLSNGAMPRTALGNPLDWTPNVPGQTQGPRPSRLYDPRTGTTMAAAGWDGVITYALMPSFAPDGKQLAFNHYDTGTGHTLAVMQFDQASRTFGQLVDVATDPGSYLGWPSFTPDGASILYQTATRQDYGTWQGANGDLMVADLASKTSVKLDALNGYAGGKTYLPYGEAEAHLNYEPTILPVAVGGYYWVVFTSLREYGNSITDPIAQDVFTRRRKLWVAALDVPTKVAASAAAHDVSHPAFYLPGQELAAGNMRGFWALDPCKANAQACQSGAECCGGFCRPGSDGKPVCVAPPSGCSQEYESCKAAADCCGAAQGYQCVNGHCAQPPPR